MSRVSVVNVSCERDTRLDPRQALHPVESVGVCPFGAYNDLEQGQALLVDAPMEFTASPMPEPPPVTMAIRGWDQADTVIALDLSFFAVSLMIGDCLQMACLYEDNLEFAHKSTISYL